MFLMECIAEESLKIRCRAMPLRALPCLCACAQLRVRVINAFRLHKQFRHTALCKLSYQFSVLEGNLF